MKLHHLQGPELSFPSKMDQNLSRRRQKAKKAGSQEAEEEVVSKNCTRVVVEHTNKPFCWPFTEIKLT